MLGSWSIDQSMSEDWMPVLNVGTTAIEKPWLCLIEVNLYGMQRSIWGPLQWKTVSENRMLVLNEGTTAIEKPLLCLCTVKYWIQTLCHARVKHVICTVWTKSLSLHRQTMHKIKNIHMTLKNVLWCTFRRQTWYLAISQFSFRDD